MGTRLFDEDPPAAFENDINFAETIAAILNEIKKAENEDLDGQIAANLAKIAEQEAEMDAAMQAQGPVNQELTEAIEEAQRDLAEAEREYEEAKKVEREELRRQKQRRRAMLDDIAARPEIFADDAEPKFEPILTDEEKNKLVQYMKKCSKELADQRAKLVDKLRRLDGF